MESIIPGLIITRNICGYIYGATIWSGITRKELSMEPLMSSLLVSSSGFLGLIAAHGCSLISSHFCPQPLGDAILIFALCHALYAQYKK